MIGRVLGASLVMTAVGWTAAQLSTGANVARYAVIGWTAHAASISRHDPPHTQLQRHGVVAPLRSVSSARVIHGLALSLEIGGTLLPSDALALVSINARNVADHPVYLTNTCDGFSTFVEAQVLDAAGRILYPPAFVDPPRTCHVGARVRVIKPGHRLTVSPFVILRGSRVRIHAVVSLTGKSVDAWKDIYGRTVRVTLHPASPVPATKVHSESGVYVRFPQFTNLNEGIWYQYWERCRGASGEFTEGTTAWSMTFRDNAVFPAFPDCPTPIEWHVIAGQDGERIATADYVYPTASPSTHLAGVRLQSTRLRRNR